MLSPSHPRLILVIASVTLVLGLAADVDDFGPILHVAALVATVGALVVIALLLPAVVTRVSQGATETGTDDGGASHL